MVQVLLSNINRKDPFIYGRELHEFLGIKDLYTVWFKRMIAYGFRENVDFTEVPYGRCGFNHILKADMALEIAIIQRNEPGKKVRQAFIDTLPDREKTHSGRELHRFLDLKTPYKAWIRRYIGSYVEGADYLSVFKAPPLGRPGMDHILSADTAREIAILNRSKQGRTLRRELINKKKTQ